jgi:hypothetical protein
VDFLTAQHAVVKLSRDCVFPPAIAEFKKAAADVVTEINSKVREAADRIANGQCLYGSPSAYIDNIYENDPIRDVINFMGGKKCVIIRAEKDGNEFEIFDFAEFEKTYRSILWTTGMFLPGVRDARLLPKLPDGGGIEQ